MCTFRNVTRNVHLYFQQYFKYLLKLELLLWPLKYKSALAILCLSQKDKPCVV